MTLKKVIGSFFACVRPRSSSRAQASRWRPPKSRRLQLESLESRALLSATSWSNEEFVLPTETDSIVDLQAANSEQTSQNAVFSESNDQSIALANPVSVDGLQESSVQTNLDDKLAEAFNASSASNVVDENYAVLFVGGVEAKQNHVCFYTTLRSLYTTLVSTYRLSGSNIYVLYADGDTTNTSINSYDSFGKLVTSDMSFATSNGSPVYAATKEALTGTFGALATRMTADSHLLFYTYDHGSGKKQDTTDYNDYLCGWAASGSEYISGEFVSSALGQIKQGYVTCAFGHCFSGGILDDILSPETGEVCIPNYDGSAHFYGMASTNHYEVGRYDYAGNYETGGFAFCFVKALLEYNVTADVFNASKDYDVYADTDSYENNGGTYYDYDLTGKLICHPWGVGEVFPIFNPTSLVVTTNIDVVDESDGLISLREAISYAGKYNYGTTITFDSSLKGKTISLNGKELNIDKALTIDASSLYDSKNETPGITIDAGSKSRVMRITAGTEKNPVVLKGLAIQKGKVSSDNGGGICLEYGALSTINVTISDNVAEEGSGGGVFSFGRFTATNTIISGNSASGDGAEGGWGGGVSSSGRFTAINTTIVENSASCYGGGVCASGRFTATNTTISGNSADDGGGVGFVGYFTATNTTIVENSASYYGGGVCVMSEGNFTATNTTISGNSAYYGGGVFVYSDGNCTVTNTTISGNSARYDNLSFTGGYGGGVYVYSDGRCTATNTTITGNSAYFSGGGVYVYSDGNCTVTNTTILENTAGFGGGVYVRSDGNCTATNTTISGNSARYGGGAYVYGTFHFRNSIIAANLNQNYKDIYEDDGVVDGYNNLSTYSFSSGADNILYDASLPLFKNAKKGNYRLAVNSQAIDKGSNDYAFSAGMDETWTDMDGGSRFVGSSIDIGAYEHQEADEVTLDLAFYQPDGWNDSMIVSSSSDSTSSRTTYSKKQDVYVRFAFNSNEAIDKTFTLEIYVDGKLKNSRMVDGTQTDVVSGVVYTYSLGKLEAGEHTITAELDGADIIAESDEDNNERSFTITVLPDDKYESNDTLETATDLGTITYSKTCAGLIAGMNRDQDWYKFTLTRTGVAGSYVEATYTHVADRDDVNLYLYDASGKQLLKSKGTTGTERISLEGLAAGTYYVMAYNYLSVDNNVEYSLKFKPVPTTDLAFYQPTGWTDSVIVTNSSSATSSKAAYSENQNAYVKFAFKSNEAIDGKFVQRLYVDGKLKKSYTVYGTKSDVVSGINYTSSLGKLAAGEHTITVKLDDANAIAESNEGNNERSVTITVLPDDKYESNDTLKTATNLGTIESSQKYSGLIAGLNSNQDWYKFTLASAGVAGSYVEATYTHVTDRDDVNLFLYDASGKLLLKSKGTTGTERISLEGLAAGTYYVKAYNYLSVANNVDYTLKFTVPTTTDLAFYQPTGQTDSVIVTNSSSATSSKTAFSENQNVYVKFAFKSNEAINGTFTHGIYLDGQLKNAETVDGTKTDVVSGVLYTYSLGKLATGEHTITVKLDAEDIISESDETNNERSFTITVLPDDKYESNDTLKTATDLGTLRTQRTYAGLIAGMNSNVDWYKFTLTSAGVAGTYVEATYTHVADRDDVNLYLYNASGKLLLKSKEATGTERISLEGLAAGTYYVKAYNYRNVDGVVEYSLKFKPVPTTDLAFYKPTGWANSVIVADSASATSSKAAYSENQNVYVRFAFYSNEAIDGKFVQRIYVDGKLKKTCTVYGTKTDVVSGVNYTYSLGKLAAGEHTITVKLDDTNAIAESYESNNLRWGTINVLSDDKYESNDTLKTATNLGTIESSQKYSGLIAGLNSNQDWYKFTLANAGVADSYVEATYTHVTDRDDVNLFLYDASGKLLLKSKGTTGTERISLEGLAAGTYYVKAYNYLSVANNVDYTLTFALPTASNSASDSKLPVATTCVEPALDQGAKFRSVFEDSSFVPFEEEDEFDFAQEFFDF